MLMLVLMELPDESTAMVNPWDVAERIADGWTVVAQGVL